jgi:hypothetical protein
MDRSKRSVLMDVKRGLAAGQDIGGRVKMASKEPGQEPPRVLEPDDAVPRRPAINYLREAPLRSRFSKYCVGSPSSDGISICSLVGSMPEGLSRNAVTSPGQ